MKEKSPARLFSKPLPCNCERVMAILLVMIFLTAIWQVVYPAPVAASPLVQPGESSVFEPAPPPNSEGADSTPRSSPVIAVLVLLAPLVFIAWRSWGHKESKITASCCLPVIDENQRPFQIQDDESNLADASKL